MKYGYKRTFGGSLGVAQQFSTAFAQGVILESWEDPCMEPASPSAWVSASLSLSVSLINK